VEELWHVQKAHCPRSVSWKKIEKIPISIKKKYKNFLKNLIDFYAFVLTKNIYIFLKCEILLIFINFYVNFPRFFCYPDPFYEAYPDPPI